jgi:transcriptional regulator GlxA family with amidase domain
LSGVAEAPANGPSCEFTTMLCGELDFAMGPHNPVLLALPDCFVVHAQDGGESFRKLASVLIATAGMKQTGRQVVMNKLAETLFTIAVCEYANAAGNRQGLFAALADPRMTRVLEAIHRRSGENWDLQALAGVAGMSRSAFASHFAQVMGIPPMQYLASWRITQARQLLKDRRLSVAAIAEQLGYKSETAFRKLFKRLEGIGPGRARAAARNDGSLPDE